MYLKCMAVFVSENCCPRTTTSFGSTDDTYLPPETSEVDYYRWLYTAFTRATEQIYLVNWP